MRGFRPFSGSPGLRAGSGAADFLHARHPIPQSRSAPAGGYEPRPRSWPWSWRWQIREARQHVCSVGAGRGTPVAGTGCWQTGMARSVPVRRDPGACLFVRQSGGSRMPIRVSAGPKAGERTNAGSPSAGCPACRDMRGSVNRTAPSVCRKGVLAAGTGALPCLPAKMKGAPKGSLPHQKLTLKNYPLFGRPP